MLIRTYLSDLLKEAVSRDFLAFFFSLIQPIWAPDKHSKMVSLKLFDSAQYHTAQRREIEMSKKSKIVSHSAELDSPQCDVAQNRTPHSVLLRRVGLRAV